MWKEDLAGDCPSSAEMASGDEVDVISIVWMSKLDMTSSGLVAMFVSPTRCQWMMIDRLMNICTSADCCPFPPPPQTPHPCMYTVHAYMHMWRLLYVYVCVRMLDEAQMHIHTDSSYYDYLYRHIYTCLSTPQIYKRLNCNASPEYTPYPRLTMGNKPPRIEKYSVIHRAPLPLVMSRFYRDTRCRYFLH